MKEKEVIIDIDTDNLDYSVMYFNKRDLRGKFDEKIKNGAVKYLKSIGYNVFTFTGFYKTIFLNEDKRRLLLLSKEECESYVIIVSNEDLSPYIKEYVIQNIPDFYMDILEKFKDTELYNCVEKVIYHIEKNYTLSDLSTETCMTSRNFTRIFKSISGISFLEFYRPFKIELAKDMLRQDMKICDVATGLGFNETSYFNRVFKKMIGMTPSKYKESMKHKK